MDRLTKIHWHCIILMFYSTDHQHKISPSDSLDIGPPQTCTARLNFVNIIQPTFSSCTQCNELAAYRCMYLSICVHPSTNSKCFFSNMPQWIFMILENNDHLVGGGGAIGMFRNLGSVVIQGSFRVIVQICSKCFFLYIIQQMLMKLGCRNTWSEVIYNKTDHGSVLINVNHQKVFMVNSSFNL